METFNIAHHPMKVTWLRTLFLIVLLLDPMRDPMTPCLLPSSTTEKYCSDFHRNQWKLGLFKFLVNTFMVIFIAGFGSLLTSRAGKLQLEGNSHTYKNSASEINFILGWDSSVSMKAPIMSSLTVSVAQVAFKINGDLVNTISEVLGIMHLILKHI